MTNFGSAFMMKSPLKEHGEKFREKAKKLSKDTEQGDYDRENPKVNKLLEKAEKAEKEHDSPLNERYYDTDTFYGGDIKIPDLSDVGEAAAGVMDKDSKKKQE